MKNKYAVALYNEFSVILSKNNKPMTNSRKKHLTKIIKYWVKAGGILVTI